MGCFQNYEVIILSKIINNKNTAIVGTISEVVVNEWNLINIVGKQIYKKAGFYKHISKHINQFKSLKSYETAVSNIENIILSPDLISYNETNKSLEYFKFLEEYVCLCVNIEDKDSILISSLFPVSESKFKNKQEKMLLKKYVINYNEEEYNKKAKDRYLKYKSKEKETVTQ